MVTGFRGPLGRRAVWRGAGLRGALPPDSHVLEEVLHTLHQDDAVERGMLAHHAAGAVPAHHELHEGRDVSGLLGVSISQLPSGSRPGPWPLQGTPS